MKRLHMARMPRPIGLLMFAFVAPLAAGCVAHPSDRIVEYRIVLLGGAKINDDELALKSAAKDGWRLVSTMEGRDPSKIAAAKTWAIMERSVR